MKTIWKFPLEVTDNNVIKMPKGAQILSVQVQHNIPCLWAAVDPEAELETRTIFTVGTGHPISLDAGRFIGTYQLNYGRFMGHVFESEMD